MSYYELFIIKIRITNLLNRDSTELVHSAILPTRVGFILHRTQFDLVNKLLPMQLKELLLK